MASPTRGSTANPKPQPIVKPKPRGLTQQTLKLENNLAPTVDVLMLQYLQDPKS